MATAAFESPYQLIQGPPGTGKSKTIVALIDEFIARRREKGITKNRILITTFSYAASEVLIDNLCSAKDENGTLLPLSNYRKFFLSSSFRGISTFDRQNLYLVQKLPGDKFRSNPGWSVKDPTGGLFQISARKKDLKIENFMEDNSIFFGNAHQLYHTSAMYNDQLCFSDDPLTFDLIVVDEASQYPTDQMLGALHMVNQGTIKIEYNGVNEKLDINDLNGISLVEIPDDLTQVVIVGDNNQLPPVLTIKPAPMIENLLSSIFDYCVDGFKMGFEQLYYNYRSHNILVKFIESLGLYRQFKVAPNSKNESARIDTNNDFKYDFSKTILPWTKEILDPKNIVISLIHSSDYDTSVSRLEADITRDLVLEFIRVANFNTPEDERKFWQEEIGIVSPHNAQNKTIVNSIFDTLTDKNDPTQSLLQPDELMRILSNSIYSVEKFQGSERSIMIASIGVSSEHQLKVEEGFLYNRNRLNVLITRAKHKMILICSKNFLNYVPNDADLLFDSSFSRRFVDYCDTKQQINYGKFPISVNYRRDLE